MQQHKRRTANAWYDRQPNLAKSHLSPAWARDSDYTILSLERQVAQPPQGWILEATLFFLFVLATGVKAFQN